MVRLIIGPVLDTLANQVVIASKHISTINMKNVFVLLSLLATALANPSGVYTGSKTVLGETINAQISVQDDTTLDLAIR